MINNVIVTKGSGTLKIEIELKASKFVRIVLAVVFGFSLLLPVTGLVFAISNNAMNFGIFIGISLFIAVISRPLFRQLMWHSYGKDTFVITENKVIYTPFIRFFKLPPTEFEYDKLEVLFSDRELYKEDRIGTIVFLEGENKIKSTLKMIEIDFKKILSEEIFK